MKGACSVRISALKTSMLTGLMAGMTITGCHEDLKIMDAVDRRKQMVAVQLKGRDISSERVLQAMEAVPRHDFVPIDLQDMAYDDRPLPIGYGQTISQPYIVAFMTQALEPDPDDVVLEIGTGSGYQAAVLSKLVREVYSIEIVRPLGERAMEDLKRLSMENVHVRIGDGYLGWPEAAPFDAVIVTCAPDHIPRPLVDQLREGGRMIIPVGESADQELYLLEKQGGEVVTRSVLAVRFVPMSGKAMDAAQ
jgi:protein-L-isoaspartate(D-aspartate) O-methyltransferase